MAYQSMTNNQNQTDVEAQFIAKIQGDFAKLDTEIAARNEDITERDAFIYGDILGSTLDIPIGHDFTPVNWLRRTVEIHKNMFMARGFQVISTYDNIDLDSAQDDKERERLEIENDKQKEYAEQRMKTIDAIQRDNGGAALWSTLAENASAVGDAAIKMYYNEDEKKIELCEIESIDNLYVLWNKDDFRDYDAVAYVYQISKQDAIGDYGADDDVTTSPMGSPFGVLGNVSPQANQSGQPMVTVMEITGKIEGWAISNDNPKQVPIGQETEFNALIIGGKITRMITDSKKIPKYYIFPNKKQRRRPWGVSDVSDAAIQINQTYIETLSDWRTHAAKVNFQKFKGFGFGMDTQLPKYEERTVQILPLSEGQDLVRLDQGSAEGVDFSRQMDELKEQFVRETGISRVLFDDPSVTLNSNQALLTSMKPTSDIAEAKKQLWAPIIVQLFNDALEMLAAYQSDLKDLLDSTTNWYLKVMWPSVMQKEDPVYQQMLLNRFNAGTMSVQSYLEAQGESKEEIDRLRDELEDPVTAAILSRGLPAIARKSINEYIGMPPWGYVVPKVQLRGDLAPQEVGNMAHNYQWDQGPYGPAIGPQGFEGAQANQNFINSGFVTDTKQGAQANYQNPPAQVATAANNQPGTGVVSQPGSGATATSPQGAINQQVQQSGG